MDFRYNRHFKAKAGEKGMTKGMHGRGAENLYVSVPQEPLFAMLKQVRLSLTWSKWTRVYCSPWWSRRPR